MHLRSATMALVLFCGAAPALAAPPPPPLLGGWGERVVHVRDLPPEIRGALKAQTKNDLAVGLVYRHAFLFHESFDVWTWGGRYVLYEGSNFWETTPEELERLIGKLGVAALSKPWNYWIPPAWLGLAALIGFVGVLGYFSSHGKAQRLSRAQHAREALQFYARCFHGEEEPSREDKQAALGEAIQFLHTQYGMTAVEAANDLRLLIREIERDRSQPFRYHAAELEKAGQFTEAFDNYLLAAAIMEEWDPADHAFLRAAMERVRSRIDKISEADANAERP